MNRRNTDKAARGGKSFLGDKAIYILLTLLLIERIVVFFELGAEYMSNSDDLAYLESGIRFAKTGLISMWWDYPSAMIMPAMPVLIGSFAVVFGEGPALIAALKMLWIIMGVMTAYIAYKSVRIFLPNWCGLFAAASFFIPNVAWMNNVLLTETPYAMLLLACVYFTLQMGQRDNKRDFALYLASFMLALMFRTNIVSILFFTAAYLLIAKKRPAKQLLKRGAILAAAVLLFVIPWSIRNYIHFDRFIPFTYGVGNPVLLGTYQGEGYPEDADLDYDSNVPLVMRERYPEHYKPEGSEKTEHSYWVASSYDSYGDILDMKYAQMLSLEEDGLKAEYRMAEWWKNDPMSFLKSYLIIKPRWMLNWSWAWECVLATPYSVLHLLSQINFVFCCITVLLSLLLKKHRKPVFFITIVYFANVYIHATAFVSDRYASTILLLRFVLTGFGAGLVAEAAGRLKSGSMRRRLK